MVHAQMFEDGVLVCNLSTSLEVPTDAYQMEPISIPNNLY